MAVCILLVLRVLDKSRLAHLQRDKLVEEFWVLGTDPVGLLQMYRRFWVSCHLRHQSSLWWQ